MKVTYVQNTDGGCDWYRAVQPIETAAAHNAFKAKRVWPQEIVCDAVMNPERFKTYMDADVFVLQRIIGIGFMRKINEHIRMHNPKAKIVMDFDDNVFRVSPLSNHYVDYGTEDYRIDFPDGSHHWAWKDGEGGFDVARNKKRIQEIIDGVKMVDMITVTTPILADVFRQYNENVRVLPNCIDAKRWKKWPLVKDEQIRLFWAGGQSHWEDLFVLRNVLPRIAKQFPQVKIVMMGWKPQGIEQTIPKGQFEYHDWVETIAYPFLAASLNADIALIPLKDTEFNRCKSPIKLVEMSALGIPSAVSLVSPYKEFAELGEENGVFVEGNDEEAWFEAISFMVESPEMRKTIGDNARQTVLEHFEINTQYAQWANAYSEVLTWENRPLQQKP